MKRKSHCSWERQPTRSTCIAPRLQFKLNLPQQDTRRRKHSFNKKNCPASE